MTQQTFSQQLLAWFEQYGRKDLPWQHQPTPYRVWVSEIMLQQTQVTTVIPYYQRFMQRFPDLHTLATASLDEVLHFWTGLGYYARARNLHQAAQQIVATYKGHFPTEQKLLMQLPGIGRSTAGAILALAFGYPYAILDGNVKRVLCRYYGIAEWPGKTKITNQLWQLAESNLPSEQITAYTQAIMDLGATVCTRPRPHCVLCPFEKTCIAHQQRDETAYPATKPRKTLPVKTTTFIMLQNLQGEILLEKRPLTGIWGGLWSFPECATLQEVPTWCQQHLHLTITHTEKWQSLRHTFTHFHLEINPVHIYLKNNLAPTTDFSNRLWYDFKKPPSCGLAAPVARLLKQLALPTGELFYDSHG